LNPPEPPLTAARAARPGPPDAPFDAPWQARAFALAVAAHEAGLFDWPEWSAALGHALEGAAPDGSDYYERWLVALEALVAARGGADTARPTDPSRPATRDPRTP
jgi:nitrile hydratase accessory protein